MPSEEDYEYCLSNGYSEDDSFCQNHITLLEESKSDQVMICGTNAGRPLCRFYIVENTNSGLEFKIENQSSGSEIISTSTKWTLESIYEAKSKHLYVAKELENHRADLVRFAYGTKKSDFLRNHEKTFSSYGPIRFIKMIDHMDHIFLFFIETRRDGTDVSRVATVCKNDLGGSQNILSDRFTTFVKSTLECPVSDSFAFR